MRTIVMSNGMKRCLLSGALAFLMGVSAAARADLMVPTVTGADISVPSTLGTFHFSLPVNSVITRVILFSPEYSYVEAVLRKYSIRDELIPLRDLYPPVA